MRYKNITYDMLANISTMPSSVLLPEDDPFNAPFDLKLDLYRIFIIGQYYEITRAMKENGII